MTIRTFAEKHRLRTVTDSDGSHIIPGRSGQIYEHSSTRLGVTFDSERHTTREGWNNRRRQCVAAGMTLWQDGDYEGSLLFDPSDPRQTEMAIRVAGCRVKRNQSPAQLANLLRNAPRLTPLGAQDASERVG